MPRIPPMLSRLDGANQPGTAPYPPKGGVLTSTVRTPNSQPRCRSVPIQSCASLGSYTCSMETDAAPSIVHETLSVHSSLSRTPKSNHAGRRIARSTCQPWRFRR
jgi:hypothetical protein